jgi:hypothetical protein
MKSESLKHVRTMRDVASIHEVYTTRKTKTHNSLSSDESVEALMREDDLSREDQLIVQKERRRLESFYGKVERSQKRLLQLRGKLAHQIHRNEALMKIRRELQEEKRHDSHESKPKTKKLLNNKDFEY